jgi:hypothetical protein
MIAGRPLIDFETGTPTLKTSSLLNPISPGILRDYLKINDFP